VFEAPAGQNTIQLISNFLTFWKSSLKSTPLGSTRSPDPEAAPSAGHKGDREKKRPCGRVCIGHPESNDPGFRDPCLNPCKTWLTTWREVRLLGALFLHHDGGILPGVPRLLPPAPGSAFFINVLVSLSYSSPLPWLSKMSK